MMKVQCYRRNAVLAAVLGIALIFSGCGRDLGKAEIREGKTEKDTGVSGRGNEKGEGDTGVSGGGNEKGEGDTGVSGEGNEKTEDEIREEACRLVENIDFSAREVPIDLNRYDEDMDKLYKEAFFKAVTGQVPIQLPDSGKTSFYRDLLPEIGKLRDEEVWQAVRESDYFYQDFDGDGLPELTVNTEGPCVLKYLPENGQVGLIFQKEPGWNLLGCGQMLFEGSGWEEDGYFHYRYGYEALEPETGPHGGTVSEPDTDWQGNGTLDGENGLQRVFFQDILASGPGGWEESCRMSVEAEQKEYENIFLQSEQAAKLQKGYWDARDNVLHPMSFSAFFGEDDQPGFWPGSDSQPRYWPERTDSLAVNEEEGEEWELYRRMLEGDFSLVDSERWGSLQWNYEDALKEGDGKCNWEYFLMDFDQDGCREMVIRLRPEGVNNMAFFRCVDGRVKMWGSYNSADSHGYMVPLANGKILSVYWYQDDKDWWIERLNFEGYCVKERCYRTGMRRKDCENPEEAMDLDSVLDEGEEWYCYFQDYYQDGSVCGSEISLSEEEWAQIEEVIEGLYIPENVWKSCSVFTPKAERPDIPSVG